MDLADIYLHNIGMNRILGIYFKGLSFMGKAHQKVKK
jgi:hypothetical protein